MSDDILRLGIAVDSTQAAGAAATLDRLAKAGAGAETATTKVATSAKSMSQALAAAASSTTATAMQRIQASTEGLAKSQARAAQQSLQLSNQLQDFFVSVQAGQSPLTAAIQQGSQLSAVYGGAGNAFKALTGIFTASRVAIGGAAAAVAAVGFELVKGADQSRDFARAIALTGGAAGITEGQFDDFAKSVAASTQTAIGSARETLQQLVETGQFTGSTLKSAATAAELFARATGQSAGDVVKGFAASANEVAKSAETLNRTYHFLSAAQLEDIRNAEDQGSRQRALGIEFDALGKHLSGAATELGTFERGWNSVTTAVSAALQKIRDFGRDSSTTRIAALQSQLDDVNAKLAPRGRSGVNSLSTEVDRNPRSATFGTSERQAALDLKASLEARIKGENDATAARTKYNEQQTASNQLAAIHAQFLDRSASKQKEIADAAAVFLKTDQSQARVDDLKGAIAGIQERFKATAGPKPIDLGQATIEAQVKGIQEAFRTLADGYRNSEQVLDAIRSAGQISDQHYFDAKIGFIKANESAEIKRLQDENAARAADVKSGKDVIANQAQIAANKTQIARITADASTQELLASMQLGQAQTAIARAYQESERSARDYIQSIQDQAKFELSIIGVGDERAQQLRELFSLEQRYSAQRRQLDGQRDYLTSTGSVLNSFNDAAVTDVEHQLALLERTYSAEVKGAQDSAAAIKAANADWTTGASRAIQNYGADAANLAKQTQDLFTNAFRGMEDALVEFATTGKLRFADLARSIIADLIRIQIRAQLAGIFSYFGGGTKTGGTPVNGSAGTGSAVPVAHGGGVIGADSFTHRVVVPAMFSGAPRLHSGLAADEYPAILQRGEGVFTRAQMAAMGGRAAETRPANVTIINNSGTPLQGQAQTKSDGSVEVMLRAVTDHIADGLQSGHGSVHQVLRNEFGLKRRMDR